MNEAKKVYEQVISYGHPGWMIAAYSQLGLAYRDLARAVENVEVPRSCGRILTRSGGMEDHASGAR